MIIPDPHARGAAEVAERLAVAPDTGLTGAEAARRLRAIGPNRLRQQKPVSLLTLLLHQFRSVIVWLLAAASAFSLAIGDHLEAAAIVVVLLLNGAIGFVTELKAARSMEALRRIAEVRTRVRRDGAVRMIDARDIVPGDVVLLEGGDVVTADLRLLTASNLYADESVLTGESATVEKATDPVAAGTVLGDRVSMLYKGAAITQGAGEAVAVATGMQTELGRISQLAQEAESETSPLELRLARLGHVLIWLTLVLAAATAVTGILRGYPMGDMVQTGVALAVAAIPEGLPVVATLALARGMWRMAQRNALIRRLSAVETLGATTLVLTDKTGTLTENRMTLARCLLDGQEVTLPLPGSADGVCRMALEVGALCTNAELGQDGQGDSGDPMELALLRAAQEAGAGPDHALRRHGLPAFDPARRMMAAVHDSAGDVLHTVKGAPEAVLEVCTHVQGADGPRPLTEAARADWLRRADAAAAEGLRTLGLARKSGGDVQDDPYQGLVLVGLACLADPLRPGIPPAIAACRDAGIRVVMVTGDHAQTAARIAADAGITGKGAQVIAGQDLVGVDLKQPDPALRDRLRATDVFARVAPETKLALVGFYQRQGAVVAMTGDGVNDAPALKKADIGIAMGQRGTQVAREAAEMVLKDDDFATIVEAVRHGRVIFGNIRKFIVYLMSCNLCEVLVVTLAVGAGLPAPLLPLQILFLNLVTDVFPAFALGLGQGDGQEMARPPRDPRDPIVGTPEWIRIALLGACLTAATLAAFALALFWLDLPHGQAVTVAFVTLALGQLWNVFNIREAGAGRLVNDVTRNRYVWGALALCSGLVAAALWLPGLSRVLQLPAPGTAGLVLAGVMSVAALGLGQLALAVSGRRTPVTAGSA